MADLICIETAWNGVAMVGPRDGTVIYVNPDWVATVNQDGVFSKVWFKGEAPWLWVTTLEPVEDLVHRLRNGIQDRKRTGSEPVEVIGIGPDGKLLRAKGVRPYLDAGRCDGPTGRAVLPPG